MHNKLSLICVVVLMVSAGSVFAGLWTGGAGTSNWNDGANWEEGYAPTATTAVYLDATGLAGRNPFIDGVAGFASVGLFGDAIGRDPNPSGPFMLSVKNGGSLTVAGDAYLGMGGTAAILDVSGAGSSVSVGTNNASSFLVAHSAPGTINQTGGTVSCTQALYLGWDGVSAARYNLNGGLLDLGALSITIASGIMDITGGTLKLNGDQVGTIDFWKGSNVLKAYNGTGTLVYDYNVTNPGHTTVTAIIPEPVTLALLGLGGLLLRKRSK